VKDERKTKKQLIEELNTLREQLEQKAIKMTSEAGEDSYRVLMEQASDGIFITDTEGRYIDVNRAGCELLGYTREEILDLKLPDLVPGEELESQSETIDTLLDGQTTIAERNLLRKDGSIVPTEISAKLLPDGRLQGIVRDVSERKKYVSEIIRSREQYRSLFENMINAFALHRVVCDEKGRPIDYVFVEANPSFEELTGLIRSDIIGRRVTQVLPGIRDDKFDWIGTYGKVALPGESVRFESYSEPLDRWYSVMAYCPEPEYFVALFEDVTDRKFVQESLAESEERYRELVESTDDLITVVDGEGRFVFVNHMAEKVFGLSADKCVGMPAPDFIHPDDRERSERWFGACIEKGVSKGEIENRQVNRSTGEVFSMMWISNFHYGADGKIINIIGIARDVTEKNKLEAQLLHTQKLESLGILAGGIAHDFNNILMGVLGNAGLAALKCSNTSPVLDHISEIESAARMASDLTNQLLAYSGKGRFVVQPIDISTLVEEMSHLLKTVISKNVVLKLDLAEHLPTVEVDVNQVRQVIMNLITNASDAIGARSGVISIQTGAMDCDEDYIAGTYIEEKRKPGLYVFVEVSDTGSGIDQGTLNSVFDPFFSTKEEGRGLGLAALLGIVRGHLGAVKIYSEPGKGSTFKIFLPASEKEMMDTVSVKDDDLLNWRGSGTVLVVDDDETVLAVSRMMLEEFGFGVLTAEDGRAGLETFRAESEGIDLVLLDMTMPRMGGEEAFREIRRVKRDVKVILTSGFNEQEATSRFVGRGLAGFIQKPYRPEDLIRVVREVLGSEDKG